jgi:hypothetical protein
MYTFILVSGFIFTKATVERYVAANWCYEQ